MGSGIALDLDAGIPTAPLSREQQIILQRHLVSVGSLSREGLRVYKPLVWHLGNIERIMDECRKLKGELIHEENQTRLDIGGL